MPANFQTVRLAPGRHERPDGGVCVMELASMLAGEPLSDHPRTVSPMLAALLRGYNDGVDGERRQSLKRCAVACLDTARGRAAERERRRRVRRWLAASRGRCGRLGAWLAALDMQQVGRSLGFQVRYHGDAALHRRTLALIDELVAVGGPPPAPPIAEPAREATPA
jgi:hypothetical protein